MPKQSAKPKLVPESYKDRQLFTEEQVSALWGVPVETLRYWRQIDKGPQFVRLSDKTIRYAAGVLDDYVQRNTHTPTMRASIEDARVHI